MLRFRARFFSNKDILLLQKQRSLLDCKNCRSSIKMTWFSCISILLPIKYGIQQFSENLFKPKMQYWIKLEIISIPCIIFWLKTCLWFLYSLFFLHRLNKTFSTKMFVEKITIKSVKVCFHRRAIGIVHDYLKSFRALKRIVYNCEWWNERVQSYINCVVK